MSYYGKELSMSALPSVFPEEEMSEEHYPAKSVGNDDVVAFDIVKMFDSFQSEELHKGKIKNLAKRELLANPLPEF